MKLLCLLLGVKEDAFPVTVDAGDIVGDLKKVIVTEARTGLEARDAFKLQLFLAKMEKDGAWLASDSEDVKQLANDSSSPLINDVTKLDPTDTIADVFEDVGKKVIHVLVKLPEGALEQASMLHSIQMAECAAQKQIALVQLKRSLQESKRMEEKEALEAVEREKKEQIPERRKRRWKDLNTALASKRLKGNSTPFSSVELEHLPAEFVPKKATHGAFYTLLNNATPIGDDVVDEMTQNIAMKTWAYDKMATCNEATRVQFMSTIFEYVVYMFKSDDDSKPDDERVTLSVQTKLTGEFVEANGVVDFMITRGKKKICVIEAKDEKFRKGSAQDILGLEVAAENINQEIMYGIVTNYDAWIFFKRTDDGIEELYDKVNPDGHDLRDELKRVASKIYAILA